MKILFVANRVPYPPFRGDKLKIFHLARRLAKKHEVHLVTVAETAQDLTYRAELEQIFHSVTLVSLPTWKSKLKALTGLFTSLPLQVAYFRSRRFAAQVESMLDKGNFDVVHVQHLRMAQFIPHRHKSRAILDLPDAFSLYWQRRSENAGSWLQRRFSLLEHKRLLNYEKDVLPAFPLNLVCSVEDRTYLEALTGARLDVLPNGVDTSNFYPRGEKPEPGRILFTGNMDYAPNVDAVTYFCQEIFPAIRQSLPHVKFVIAGQRPVPAVLQLAGEGVEVTGFIPDLATEYAKARVLVAPLRFGAGTQNKVLEALAMGIPVVCTPVGFKGLGIESGQGAVLAGQKEIFIKETLRLLQDDAYRQEVVQKGGNIIRDRFAWDAVALTLEKFLFRISGQQ
ncbi:MAG: glycosyltransferase [Bacteroidetes bacterium]|nr:glycosyltransferase [Bacteroidota bacterium]